MSLLFRSLKLPKGASLHTLRHTHGSHLLAAGRALTDVSKRLGHTNPHVTATVYAHAMPGHDDLAAAAWERFQKQEARPAEGPEEEDGMKPPRRKIPRRARDRAKKIAGPEDFRSAEDRLRGAIEAGN